MSNKKQSPLQEAIQILRKQLEGLEKTETNVMGKGPRIFQLGNDIAELERLLDKEQQTFSDIFDAGEFYGECKNQHELDNRGNNATTKEEFLNQYKP